MRQRAFNRLVPLLPGLRQVPHCPGVFFKNWAFSSESALASPGGFTPERTCQSHFNSFSCDN
eukprot:2105013-Pyramimonas_sp.AAC.1